MSNKSTGDKGHKQSEHETDLTKISENNSAPQTDESRRSAVGKLAVGGGIVGTSGVWGKPVLNSVVLPSHAQTSDDSDAGGGDGDEPPAESPMASPMASVMPSPAASVMPSPMASVMASPMASVMASPMASVMPSPMASVMPSPMASVMPSPMASVMPSPSAAP